MSLQLLRVMCSDYSKPFSTNVYLFKNLVFSAGKRIGHISLCTLYCIPSRPVVLKVVDIDPQGSMNNCWGLLEQ